MLLQISKQNTGLQFLFLVLLSLLFWVKYLIDPQLLIGSFEPYPFFEGVTSLIPDNLLFCSIIAMILSFAQSWFLYFIIQGNQLSRNPMFVALIYMLLISSSIWFMGFHPFLIINFLILASYYLLLKVYDKTDAYIPLFTASFFWSLSTFFYFPLLKTLPLLFFILMIYTLYKWREWVIVLIGFTLPYIWFLGISFVMGFLGEVLEMLKNEVLYLPTPYFIFQLPFFIWAFCLIIIIVSVIAISKNKLELELPQRRKIKVLYWSFFYFVILLFPLENQVYSLFPCFIFGSFFVAEWFTSQKDDIWKESVFYLLLFLMLMLHFILN